VDAVRRWLARSSLRLSTSPISYPSAPHSVTVDLWTIDRSGEALMGADGAGPNPDTIGALLGTAIPPYDAHTLVGYAEGEDIGTDVMINIRNATGG
jgi:hypothetical protein